MAYGAGYSGMATPEEYNMAMYGATGAASQRAPAKRKVDEVSGASKRRKKGCVASVSLFLSSIVPGRPLFSRFPFSCPRVDELIRLQPMSNSVDSPDLSARTLPGSGSSSRAPRRQGGAGSGSGTSSRGGASASNAAINDVYDTLPLSQQDYTLAGSGLSGAGVMAGGEDEFDPALEGADDDGDKTLYCFCQRVSFGEMIACDAPDCEHEWVRVSIDFSHIAFSLAPPPDQEEITNTGRIVLTRPTCRYVQFHLPCVGLKSIPDGRWFCDECRVSCSGPTASSRAAPPDALSLCSATRRRARNGDEHLGRRIFGFER